jgi:hypothetical protein
MVAMSEFLVLLEAISKNGFWFKIKADEKNQTGGILQYFEDLIFSPNAEIGPKAFFEIASSHVSLEMRALFGDRGLNLLFKTNILPNN